MSSLPRLELRLGEHQARVGARLDRWRADGVARRLLERDRTLWFEEPVPELENRLGWLDLPFTDPETVSGWLDFAEDQRADGVERVVVLGMGGSSLAPEVFQRTFGEREEFLVVLDSTHPDAVSALEAELDLAHTLFVVSSKSGSTIETRSLFEHFWSRVSSAVETPGRQFVAITDPGSSLEELARERRVQRVFLAPVDVGGRYSALSAFGLVPGALAGLDIAGLMSRARSAAEALAGQAADDLLLLGAVLGELARVGRNKLTLWTSPSIATFPDWLEQLVAESTGKQGQGILPVVGEPPTAEIDYSDDRLFLALLVDEDDDAMILRQMEALAGRGFPTATIRLGDRLDLGAEMFRWQVAVALAGSTLGINPFSQPDVQLAKRLAEQALDPSADTDAAVRAMPRASIGERLTPVLDQWLNAAPEAPYLSVQTYGPCTTSSQRALLRLQRGLRARTGRTTTVGFGPRFLHSTGQLHKGGPTNALFLQLVVGWNRDLPIPGEKVSFGGLLRAQADGDAGALLASGQLVLRVELERAVDIERVAEAVEEQP